MLIEFTDIHKRRKKCSKIFWTVHVQTIIHLPLSVCRKVHVQQKQSKEGVEKRGCTAFGGEIMSSSSSLASTISAAATAACPRHGAAKQQLSTRVKSHQKHAAGCWETSGNRRAVAVRAGPGPLTEIEPDLREDPIDKWRTNGVSPVWSSFLGFLVLAALLSEETG